MLMFTNNSYSGNSMIFLLLKRLNIVNISIYLLNNILKETSHGKLLITESSFLSKYVLDKLMSYTTNPLLRN